MRLRCGSDNTTGWEMLQSTRLQYMVGLLATSFAVVETSEAGTGKNAEVFILKALQSCVEKTNTPSSAT